MAHLQYYSYKGVGEENLKNHKSVELAPFSQPTRKADPSTSDTTKPSAWATSSTSPAKVTHQPLHRTFLTTPSNPPPPHRTGGWNRTTGAIHKEINAQIAQAFENVDHVLRDAGGAGWSQVFRVNSYHLPLNNEALEAMEKGFEEWMPGHKALWTCVGVQRLGKDDMRVEIEVQAHVPPK